MISIYDDALLAKFKAWTEGTKVSIIGPEESSRLFQTIADNTNDKPIKLPFIVLSRDGGYEITNFNKRALTYDAFTEAKGETEEGQRKTIQVNVIPITIPYRLDIYSKFFKEADAYARNLIFNIVNMPTLELELPYENTKFKHKANIRICSNNISDTSGFSERLVSGTIHRISLDINIDDAYLWDVRVRNAISIDIDGMVLEVDKYPDKESADFIRESI